MKFKVIAILLLISVFSLTPSTAQSIIQAQLSSINIDNLSDAQIQSYWDKAKSQGYTLDQLEVIATSKGMSASQFSKLRQRIASLKYSDVSTSNVTMQNTDEASISNIEKFGLEGKEPNSLKKSILFGFDFFNNPNISFTPNLNLATPTTYQLGPGDELLIDVWGAAQNNYRKQVDRQGAIRIKNIGPIYVSGLSIEKAKAKIISYLKKIYSGISASSSSYNKVYADVSLVGVRTVQVNIIGEVKVPGTYSLSGLSTVLNALYAAGGPTEKGTFRNIKLIRAGKLYSNFDIYNYLINGSEKGNSTLQDQDVIIVSPYLSKIIVVGNVKRPGIYELKPEETISNLINYFSGFTSDAYKKRLLVERVNGEQKEVSEIVLKKQPNFVFQDGDKLTVGSVIDRFRNRVTISGAVYRPGDYELTKGLTLNELLKKAAGLKEEASLDRGIIYRMLDDVKQEIIPFSVEDILNNKTTIVLQREDRVQIYSKYSLKGNYTVSIDGAVNKPQTITFAEKMHIEDLIAMSGGFKEGADPSVIDISRRVADGSFKTISKNIKKSSTNKLTLGENANFYLKPFDRVSVRYIKGYTPQKNVSILGEVKYPGTYSLANKNERISDLVKKADGFSPYAYLKGATLIRKLRTLSDKQQLKDLENFALKDSTLVIHKSKEIKIGIDLEKIMQKGNEKSKIDLILQEGDVLYIPIEKQTVEVQGEVFLPSLSRFDKSNSFKDYISKSGGYSQNAKKGRAYVIYANGDIRSTKNFIFFKTYPKIEPGALIVIPKKAERSKMSIQEILGLTTGISTLGLLIKAIFP
ncbi:SLBB domain-containing protein [Lutibacter sp.]|uniref:SLBB domain-containing protein n=1 Tax=Lutibacter sp. TaxID=1925666 RepID=UPI0025C3CA20|nr:SLBB domain-containing protein [Lutibacter sp.]MCF6182110.1 SLBB domain-containing protein [Lutibacter sp.]